jgi:uncharacterized protein VirK/YbjX
MVVLAPGAASSWGRRAAAFKLLQGVVACDVALGERRRAGRLVLRCLRRPADAIAWLDAAEGLRAACALKTLPSDLLRKPSRSFLHADLAFGERALILQTHYGQLRRRFGAPLVRAWLAGEAVELALQAKSADAFRLRIGRSLQMGREGELHFALLAGADQRRIASMAMAIGPGSQGEALFLGGIQGCSGPNAKEATVEATRALHGLRPKDLLVHAAYAFAARSGICEILGVGAHAHVHADPRCGAAWPFDYDAFWMSLGGVPTSRQLYRLPAVRERRLEGDVAAARRKAWRLKYALVDGLAADIAALGDVAGAGERLGVAA